jgi:hypothetical protein
MKPTQTIAGRFFTLAAVLALCGTIAQPQLRASGGSGGGVSSTTPTPIPDKGGLVKSGGGGATGGGGGRSTAPSPSPAPAPAPSPALPAATPLTSVIYAASGPINGVYPVCTGSYQIAQYYPTLMDMTVNAQVSSLNVPDGTVLYVHVVGSGVLYPYLNTSMVIVGGAGSCSEKLFSMPGDTLVGVVISDASGNPVFAGQ